MLSWTSLMKYEIYSMMQSTCVVAIADNAWTKLLNMLRNKSSSHSTRSKQKTLLRTLNKIGKQIWACE